MAMLVQQQQQANQGASFLQMYSSQSIQSVQILSSSSALNAYQTAVDPSTTPSTDAPSDANVDTVA
jgi:hypothetical protein